MEMTNEEILRSYRQAKDPREQITILSELNLCGTARIVEILTEGGVDPETLPKIKMTRAPRVDRLRAGRPKVTPKAVPKTPKDDTTLEKEIEGKLVARVKAYGGRCMKWVCPMEAGVPDRIVLLPGGRIVFVETKRPKGGVLSSLQEYWGRTLRDLGFDAWVIWTREDLANFEREVLGGER